MDENKINELKENILQQIIEQHEYNDVKQDSRIECISNQLSWVNRWLFLIFMSIILPIIIKVLANSYIFMAFFNEFKNLF